MDALRELRNIIAELDTMRVEADARMGNIERRVRAVCAEVERRQELLYVGLKAILAQLNHRQFEIILHMVDGKSDREIMQHMNLTKSAFMVRGNPYHKS